MAKANKIESGYISHQGATFNAADVVAMSEAEFVRISIEQSASQAPGVDVNYSNFGEAQESMLKAAYQLAKESVAPTPAPQPAKKQDKTIPEA